MDFAISYGFDLALILGCSNCVNLLKVISQALSQIIYPVIYSSPAFKLLLTVSETFDNQILCGARPTKNMHLDRMKPSIFGNEHEYVHSWQRQKFNPQWSGELQQDRGISFGDRARGQ